MHHQAALQALLARQVIRAEHLEQALCRNGSQAASFEADSAEFGLLPKVDEESDVSLRVFARTSRGARRRVRTDLDVV